MSTSRKSAKAATAGSGNGSQAGEYVEFLDPDGVLLDKNNPRVLPILAARGWTNPNQDQIAQALRESRDWKSGRGGFTTSFEDFYNAVIQDGRINEPPVVQRQYDGTFIVLHGNNRMLVAKEAKRQGIAGFELVRCRVLPPDTPQAEIEKYMQIAHDPRTKQADWHPAAHAYQLYRLASTELGGIGRMSSRDLQEEFQMGPGTIKKTVMAYSAMQKYMAETKDQRPLTLWARFYELQRPGPAEMYANPALRDAVHKLIREDKLKAEDVKYLPKIRENEEAWEELTVGAGSPTAVAMVKGDVESDNDFDRIRKLTRLIDAIASTPSRAKAVRKNAVQKKAVADLVEAVRTLLENAGLVELLEPATA